MAEGTQIKDTAFQVFVAGSLCTATFIVGICMGMMIKPYQDPVVVTQVEEVIKTERIEVPIEKVVTVEVQKVVPRRIETELSENDKELIARVVMAEAAYEDPVGKRLVVDTILNRVDSPAFPDSVFGVVYQDNQFYRAVTYTQECMDAVELEVYERLDYDVLWFCADGYHPYGMPAYRHGGHYFNWRTQNE